MKGRFRFCMHPCMAVSKCRHRTANLRERPMSRTLTKAQWLNTREGLNQSMLLSNLAGDILAGNLGLGVAGLDNATTFWDKQALYELCKDDDVKISAIERELPARKQLLLLGVAGALFELAVVKWLQAHDDSLALPIARYAKSERDAYDKWRRHRSSRYVHRRPAPGLENESEGLKGYDSYRLLSSFGTVGDDAATSATSGKVDSTDGAVASGKMRVHLPPKVFSWGDIPEDGRKLSISEFDSFRAVLLASLALIEKTMPSGLVGDDPHRIPIGVIPSAITREDFAKGGRFSAILLSGIEVSAPSPVESGSVRVTRRKPPA